MPDETTRNAASRWEVASVEWHRAPWLLDRGWEPFAVTLNGPSNDGEVTVYLRRLHDDK